MERRQEILGQWLAAQTDREATEAVIALAVEEVTARRSTDSDGYDDEDETGERKMTVTEPIERPLEVDCLLRQLRSKIDDGNARAQQAERRAMLMEVEVERLGDVHDLLRQAGQVVIEIDTWRQVAACAMAQTTAEHDLRVAKASDLSLAKERLFEAETEGTLQAYATVVDGKNAEQRKSQLDAYLAKNEAVRAAREHLRAVETRVTNLEAALAVAEAEHKTALLRWNAARTQAELLAAMLAAVSGKG